MLRVVVSDNDIIMNKETFEQYLENIGGLVNGHKGRSAAGHPRARGWSAGTAGSELIHDLIEELIAAGWDKQICRD